MKIALNPCALASGALLLTFTPFSTVWAQGALAPSGAPAATMKSLDQLYAKLDARTAITNGFSLVTLAQPGSY
jgi:hypothetical protein